MQCPKCHAEVAEGSNFCTNCGYNVSEKFCSQCGAKFSGNFCPNCGHAYIPPVSQKVAPEVETIVRSGWQPPTNPESANIYSVTNVMNGTHLRSGGVVCPRCGGADVEINTFAEPDKTGCFTVLFYILLAVTVVGLLIVIPAIFRSNHTRRVTMGVCRSCGHRWRMR